MHYLLVLLLLLIGCGEKKSESPDSSMSMDVSGLLDGGQADASIADIGRVDDRGTIMLDMSGSPDAMTPDAVLGMCGDGELTGDESCDDGNRDPRDGCSSDCTVEEGFVCVGQPSICEPLETCDVNANGCDANAICVVVDGVPECKCGDGFSAMAGAVSVGQSVPTVINLNQGRQPKPPTECVRH